LWRSFWAAPVFSGAFGFDATAALITRLRTRSINLPMEAPARRMSGVVFLCIAALASVVVFTIRSSKHDLAEGVSAIPGPSVERVSVVITQGTNHTFYYRGRLAWEANRLFKFLRLPIHTGAERRQVSNESCDMLWLTFAHRGQLSHPWDLHAWEATAAGGKIDNVTGGAALSDKKRRVSVFMWELDGGLEKHRGDTIHVFDKSSRAELVRIHIH